MLKRINWKAVLYGFIWALSLSGLVVLMSFIEVKKRDLRCRDVKILIPGSRSFIGRTEVDSILLAQEGPLVGRWLNKINIQLLETSLKANPFIAMAKIYSDMDGVIHVEIEQREPVLRVLNVTNQDFYVDQNGYKIPTSPNFTANVLVASGYILEDFNGRVDTLKTGLANDLYSTALFIMKDTLWNDQIEQLYVNPQNEIEMVPRLGNHKIILGNADSLQVKFRNLLALYKEALPKVGWDAYKSINLKYASQIVCEKNPLNPTDSTKTSETIAKEVTDTIKIIKAITKTAKN
jgi:cell division protein FtsQ